jgi:hypothetical protein
VTIEEFNRATVRLSYPFYITLWSGQQLVCNQLLRYDAELATIVTAGVTRAIDLRDIKACSHVPGPGK